MHLTVKFIDKEYYIPQDVLTYIDLLNFTDSVQKQLVGTFIRKLKNEIAKGNAGLLGDKDLASEIEQQVGRFIAKLCDNGIYTRTVSDYLKNNKGYQLYSDVNKAALNNEKELLIREMEEWKAGYDNAVSTAESQITGLGFTVWSGSFVNHAIYAAMEASKLQEQSKEAEAQYQKDISDLRSRLNTQYGNARSNYINNTYIPNMESALTVFAYELLDKYVADLIAHGKFDSKTLGFVDIGRSNDLLKNLTLSQNKQAILETAFAACPYNIAVYMQAMNNNLLDYDAFQTAKVFKQDNLILSFLKESWGVVSFPAKFNINYQRINLWASFTGKTSEEILHYLTEQFAAGVVQAYSRVANIMVDKSNCREIIEGLGEKVILIGNSICIGEARKLIQPIVSTAIWEQLTEKCGHLDLLSRIKEYFPSAEQLQTKNGFDKYVIEQLAASFEDVRKELAEQIEARRVEEERQRVERERLVEEQRIADEKAHLEKQRRKELAAIEYKNKIKAAKKIAKVTVSLMVAVVILAVIFISIIVPIIKYYRAIDLIEKEQFEDAYRLLKELGNYKDAAETAEHLRFIITKESLENIAIGDYIKFGAYEQDNVDNGKEIIEWLVLDMCEDKALIISKYAIDCQPYNNKYTDVTWGTCSLRKWLNNEFCNLAFSAQEKELIYTTTMTLNNNPISSTSVENPKQDKVFLLSILEFNKYFNSSAGRQCCPTAYATAKGVYVANPNGNCLWWLRSPGKNKSQAASVYSSGSLYEGGYEVNSSYLGIRPTMWIDISSME